MGFPMAKNLIKAGYPLIAYDLNKEALTNLVKEGAQRVNPVLILPKTAMLLLPCYRTHLTLRKQFSLMRAS